MRLLSGSAVFCLTIFLSPAQAQNFAGNDPRPPVVSRSRFVLSSVDKKMVKELNLAWQQAVMGTKDTEAVVLVMRDPDGAVKAVSAGRSNQAYAFTFQWDPGIIAVFHTHPNNRNPEPQKEDIQIARRFDIPIFTITRRGMYMYDPATDLITKVKNGIDWLDSSSWPQASQEPASTFAPRTHGVVAKGLIERQEG